MEGRRFTPMALRPHPAPHSPSARRDVELEERLARIRGEVAAWQAKALSE
jgi:E3 ubiquitin-protein ligase BOI and related proteins